jgi:hypothetical protein
MKRIILLIVLISFSIVSCSRSSVNFTDTETSKYSQSSNDDCSIRLSSDKTNSALSRISFLVPEGWQEIKVNESYATADLASFLHVFIFETNAQPSVCVNNMVDVVSQQSFVEKVQILKADVTIESNPATIMKADGFTNSDKLVPWLGILMGFAYEELVYVFVWDAIGQDAIDTIVYDASYTIETVGRVR